MSNTNTNTNTNIATETIAKLAFPDFVKTINERAFNEHIAQYVKYDFDTFYSTQYSNYELMKFMIKLLQVMNECRFDTVKAIDELNLDPNQDSYAENMEELIETRKKGLNHSHIYAVYDINVLPVYGIHEKDYSHDEYETMCDSSADYIIQIKDALMKAHIVEQ